jgi:hypothetical protein
LTLAGSMSFTASLNSNNAAIVADPNNPAVMVVSG